MVSRPWPGSATELSTDRVRRAWDGSLLHYAEPMSVSGVAYTTGERMVKSVVGLRDRVSTAVARLMVGDLQRGDVPGWVLVTVMSAGLVVAIFAAFRDTIVSAVTNAIDQVVSGTGGG